MRESQLSFYFHALGLSYLTLLAAATLVGIAVTIIVLIRGRGPFATAAMIFAVVLPLIVGLMGMADGAIAAFQVIAASSVQPKPSEIALGASLSLVSLKVGTLLTAPILLLALFGSLVRALVEKPRSYNSAT